MPPLLRSELPIRAKTRHHPIVLFKKTGKPTAIVLGVTLFAALVTDWAVGLLLIELLTILFWRYRAWEAEWIFVTQKRVIRFQGVAETTTSESSLRVDRVSGARIVQSVWGKLLGYGDIELEAPGDHPEVHKLMTIGDVTHFYMVLREVIFGEDPDPDPDDGSPDHITAPLPVIPKPVQGKRLGPRLRPQGKR